MLNNSEFDENTLEKVSRMCDILHRISSVDYTRERLFCQRSSSSLTFLPDSFEFSAKFTYTMRVLL